MQTRRKRRNIVKEAVEFILGSLTMAAWFSFMLYIAFLAPVA